jgi:hypothetical protein
MSLQHKFRELKKTLSTCMWIQFDLKLIINPLFEEEEQSPWALVSHTVLGCVGLDTCVICSVQYFIRLP